MLNQHNTVTGGAVRRQTLTGESKRGREREEREIEKRAQRGSGSVRQGQAEHSRARGSATFQFDSPCNDATGAARQHCSAAAERGGARRSADERERERENLNGLDRKLYKSVHSALRL